MFDPWCPEKLLTLMPHLVPLSALEAFPASDDTMQHPAPGQADRGKGSAGLAPLPGSDDSSLPMVSPEPWWGCGAGGEQALHTPSHRLSCFLSSISDPFIFNMCSKDRSSDHYSCQSHSYGDLRELRQARFLLQVHPGEGSGGTPASHGMGGPGASEAPSDCEGQTL